MDELKKYKNLLAPIGILLVLFYAVKTYKDDIDSQVRNLIASTEKMQSLIEEKTKLIAAKESAGKVNTAFLEEDRDAFLSRVLKLATASDLVVISSRKGSSRQQPRSSKRRSARKTDETIQDYDVLLDIVGNSDSLKAFLEGIDAIDKYVMVSNIDITELAYGSDERERYNNAVLRGQISLKAKAVRKLVL